MLSLQYLQYRERERARDQLVGSQLNFIYIYRRTGAHTTAWMLLYAPNGSVLTIYTANWLCIFDPIMPRNHSKVLQARHLRMHGTSKDGGWMERSLNSQFLGSEGSWWARARTASPSHYSTRRIPGSTQTIKSEVKRANDDKLAMKMCMWKWDQPNANREEEQYTRPRSTVQRNKHQSG